MEKMDHRVRVTKHLLRNALTVLLTEKPIAAITVKELCLRAGINRGTFYTHYKDQVDLYNAVLNELFASLETYIRTLFTVDITSHEGTVEHHRCRHVSLVDFVNTCMDNHGVIRDMARDTPIVKERL